MPADGKICTFDCLYCECGFNKDRRTHSPHPTRQQVAEALEKQLIKMHNDQEHPDVLKKHQAEDEAKDRKKNENKN